MEDILMDLSEVGLIELANSPAEPILYTALACAVFVLIGLVIMWNSTK
tara:strand:- start:345 stop:488 length:144 start_codon:yes stop_codon:yes gene_type:complete